MFFFFFRLGVILLRPRSSNPIAAPASRQPATELSTGQVLRLQGVLCGLLSACFFELSSLLLLLLFVCIYIYIIYTHVYMSCLFLFAVACPLLATRMLLLTGRRIAQTSLKKGSHSSFGS